LPPPGGGPRPQACEVEVRERLRSLGASHGEGFLTTLAAIAGARNAATRIDQLNYRNDMDLQIVAPDLPALDEFTKHLQARGGSTRCSSRRARKTPEPKAG
jgi:hypothetical protein